MLSKEQLIKKMAVLIHEGNSCISWEQALKSAEAALEVLIDNLPVNPPPAITERIKGRFTIQYDNQINYFECYEELLTMRNK